MTLRAIRLLSVWLWLPLVLSGATVSAGASNAPQSALAAYPIQSISANISETFTYVVNGSFAKGPALDYSAKQTNGSNLPSWIELDQSTGVFRITPPASTLGNVYTIAVRGTDESGQSTTVDFGLVIDDANLICEVQAGSDYLSKILGCSTGSVMLRGETSTGVYRWTGPNGYTSNEQNPVVKTPGIYVLSGGSSCSRRSIVEVRPNLFDCLSFGDNNEIPVGHFTNNVQRGAAPLTVNFNGSNSYDVDGDILDWFWTWEGGAASGPTPTVYFDTEGEYNLLLTVTDDFGAKSTDRYTMIVDPPTGHGIDAFWLEAECGEVGSDWTLQADETAAGDYYAFPVRSSSGAPSDAASNRIRFTFSSPNAGDMKLFARISAASASNDSYYVRVNGGNWMEWFTDIQANGSFNWNLFAKRLPIKVGTNVVDFAYREEDTRLDKIFITSTTQTPSGLGLSGINCDNNTEVTRSANEIWLEAECGNVGSRWKTFSSSSASGNTYIVTDRNSLSSPPNDVPDNRVRFNLESDASKLFDVYARILAADVNSDSYWVRLNAGEWIKWGGGINSSGKWAWNLLPKQLTLRAGSNTLDFAFRESNTKLDKLFLTAIGTVPSGTGGTAANCDGGNDNESVAEEPTTEEPAEEPAQEPTGGSADDPTKFWLEAECALVGDRWSTENSSAAANGSYVVVKDRTSLSAPPTNTAANQVRFTVNATQAGNYNLFALVNAPSGDHNSFWVRVNGNSWVAWNRNISTGTGWKWNLMGDLKPSLRAGTNTIDFAFREDGTKLDRIHLNLDGVTPIGQGPAANNCGNTQDASSVDAVAVEVECGAYGSKWTTVEDAGASNGLYVMNISSNKTTSPPANDESQLVRLSFEITTPGSYHLFAHLHAIDPTRNSIWIQVDNGSWINMWRDLGGDKLLTNGLEWKKVNHDGADLSFSLATGTHTVTIANRETRTGIDKLQFSLSSALPSGKGVAAPNCSSSTDMTMMMKTPASSTTSVSDSETEFGADPVIDVYPNPTVDEFSLDLTSDFNGEVDMRIFDMNGRQVRELHYNKSSALMHVQVDVRALPPGIYRVHVIEGDRESVKPFVKM